ILDYAFDQPQDPAWADWAHRHCEEIETKEDAVRFSNEMLATLDDPYSKLLAPDQSKAFAAKMEGEFVGIGVKMTAATDEDGELKLDEAGKAHFVTDDTGNPIVESVVEHG